MPSGAKRDAARRADVPRSAHGEWDVEARDRDPVAVLEGQARTRVPELVPVRYERMAASPFAFFRGGAAIMAMDLSTTPVTGLTRAGVRRRARRQLRHLRHARAQRRVRHQRLRRDRARPVGVGRQAPRHEPPRRGPRARLPELASATRSCSRSVRVYREYVDQYSTMRTLDVWYDRTTADDLVAHFPKRYRAQAEARRRPALRKDHVRAVTRLTTDHEGRPRFTEDPPIVVHLDALDAEHGRRRGDGRRLPGVAHRRAPLPVRPLPRRRRRPPGRRRRQRGHPLLGGAPRGGRAGGGRAGPDRAPGEGGATVGAGAVRGPHAHRPRGPAGGLGPAPHPGRQRPVPRLVPGAERAPLLRAPAVGREGPGRPHADGPGQADPLRGAVRPGAGPGPRPDRRRRRPRRLSRPRTGVRPRDRRVRRELRGRQRAGPRRPGRRHRVRSRGREFGARRSCCGRSSPM